MHVPTIRMIVLGGGVLRWMQMSLQNVTLFTVLSIAFFARHHGQAQHGQAD